MKTNRYFLMSALLATASMAAFASPSSWDDDDDIYYNPSKVEKKAPAKQTKKADSPYPAVATDYPDPATYSPASATPGINLDDDAYNRRGQFLVADSVPYDSIDAIERRMGSRDTYAYTRRIERYHNGDVINASSDQELIDTYYAQSPEINIYVNSDWGFSPWYSGWYSPWYSSWYSPWYAGWYSPWYTGWYGPSFAWGWGGWYDPWYGPAWGWGPSWGWGGPAWGGPAWGPSWGNNNWVSNPSGATRPHRPTGGSSLAHGSNISRPGAISAGASSVTRPGNMGRPTADRYNGTYSPAGATSRPAATGQQINLNRGRNNTSTSGSYNSTNRSNSSNSSTRSTYTPSRSSSSSSSWGSGSGSHSTRGSGGSFGGGSHSGGGGGGRGRR